MSSPYVIPFNHNPIANASTTSTYTVAAGKYARVCLNNVVKPVLNSIILYRNVELVNAWPYTTTASTIYTTPFADVQAITITRSNTTFAFYALISATGTVTSTNASFVLANTVGSAVMTFSGKGITITGISVIAQSTGGNVTSILASIYDGSNDLWLKGGDVLSFTAGTLYYEEYYSIS